MQSETVTKTELEAESPESNINVSNGKDNSSGKSVFVGIMVATF